MDEQTRFKTRRRYLVPSSQSSIDDITGPSEAIVRLRRRLRAELIERTGDSSVPRSLVRGPAIIADDRPDRNWYQTGADVVISTVMPVWLSLMSPGELGMDYDRRYINESEQAKAFIRQGNSLVLSTEMLADMSSFCAKHSQLRMTGAQLSSLVAEFDATFGREGIVSWSEFINLEFGLIFQQRKSTFVWTASGLGSAVPAAQGGMLGGDNNHMWGLAQFKSSTYDGVRSWLRDNFKNSPLFLPASVRSCSFSQQLCAMYILAIINQPTVLAANKKPDTRQLYLIHNQGASSYRSGVAKNVRGQSRAVQVMLAER